MDTPPPHVHGLLFLRMFVREDVFSVCERRRSQLSDHCARYVYRSTSSSMTVGNIHRHGDTSKVLISSCSEETRHRLLKELSLWRLSLIRSKTTRKVSVFSGRAEKTSAWCSFLMVPVGDAGLSISAHTRTVCSLSAVRLICICKVVSTHSSWFNTA